MAIDHSAIIMNTRGGVGDAAVAYANEKVSRALAFAPMPVLQVRVELQRHPNPSLERPALAKGTIDVNGHIVRAQATAATMDEAIDLLEARLRRRLEAMSSRLGNRQRRTAVPAEGEWRHGDLPASRPAFYPRPADERQVIQRWTFDTTPLTIEDAVYELHLLDYDFLLFTEADAGVDSLLYRPADGGGLRVARSSGTQQDRQPKGQAPSGDPEPAPDLTVDQARARLEADGEDWVFFRDSATHRGAVLYKRFDGHYGLIAPAGSRIEAPV